MVTPSTSSSSEPQTQRQESKRCKRNSSSRISLLSAASSHIASSANTLFNTATSQIAAGLFGAEDKMVFSQNGTEKKLLKNKLEVKLPGKTKKLQELFFKNEDDNTKAKNIQNFLTKHPEYLSVHFAFKRNILHLSIVAKLPKLVTEILDKSPTLIGLKDKFNQTVYHFSVIYYNESILSILIDRAAELINNQDCKGKTALHLAVNAANIPAIKKLIQAKADIDAKDSDGNSPFSLAKNNTPILNILTSTTFPDLTKNRIHPNAIAELEKEFPTLNLFRKPENKSENGESSNTKKISDTKAGSLSLGSSSVDTNQIKQFELLLRYARIDSPDEKGHTILDQLDENSALTSEILRNAYANLCPEVTSLVEQVNSQIDKHQQFFENCLYDAGLKDWSACPAKDFDELPLKQRLDNKKGTARILWNLCSCIKPQNKENIDKLYISEMIQGLLSHISAAQIMITLQRLFPAFESKQKLIANFIAKELLVWDIYHNTHFGEFQKSLQFLISDNSQSFGENGTELNYLLNEIIKQKIGLDGNVVYINYQILGSWLSTPQISQHLPSLESLILNTLSLPPDEQRKNIQLLAQEFRSSMLMIIQRIQVKEFYEEAWVGEKKLDLAPNLCFQAQWFNHIGNFIRNIILKNKSPAKRSELIQLFIHIAAKLCSSTQSTGPELNTIMAIVSALNSTPITRMKDIHTLSEEIKEKFDAMDNLLSELLNRKWIRTVEISFLTPIPYVPLMKTDCTFAREGNCIFDSEEDEEGEEAKKIKDYSNFFSNLGAKFRSFLQFQRTLLTHSFQMQTDIFNSIMKLELQSDDELWYRSLRVYPPTIPIDGISFTELITKLNQYIEKQVLPKIEYDKQLYDSNMIMKPVMQFLLKHLHKNETSTSPSTVFTGRGSSSTDSPSTPSSTGSFLAYELEQIRLSESMIPKINTDIKQSAIEPNNQKGNERRQAKQLVIKLGKLIRDEYPQMPMNTTFHLKELKKSESDQKSNSPSETSLLKTPRNRSTTIR